MPDRERSTDATVRLDGRRVVFVLYYAPPYTSGLTLYATALAEDLAERGAEVTMVAGRHRPDLPADEMRNGVRIIRCRSIATVGKGMVMPAFLPTAIRHARAADVVVPVMPLLEAALLARSVPARRLLPMYVCDLRLGEGLPGRIVEALSARSATATLRRAPRHTVLSHDYAQASRVIASLSDRAIEVRPTVDPERFVPVPTDALRSRLGVDPDQPVVGFVGRLVAEKGIPHLIAAMRTVRARVPDAVLVIAGGSADVAGGGLQDELARQASNEPGVSFTGFLDAEDLCAFYSMCTVLALPSVDPLEAFGMVQVEAMLCGCPVVASNMPGVRVPIRATGMGLLTPPADEPALADALLRVIADRARFVQPRERVIAALDPQVPLDTFAAEVHRIANG